jgi:hypothetical protein
MLFEWDENKRRINLAKHHVDFQDAEIGGGSSQQGRAHRNERKDYQNHVRIAQKGRD